MRWGFYFPCANLWSDVVLIMEVRKVMGYSGLHDENEEAKEASAKPEWPKTILATRQYALIFNDQEELDVYINRVGLDGADGDQARYPDVTFPVDSIEKVKQIIHRDIVETKEFDIDDFDFENYGDPTVEIMPGE